MQPNPGGPFDGGPRQARYPAVAPLALRQRKDKEPVVLHSDRGCQFMSYEYQRCLKGHNLVSSMSAVGSCADNAAAEGFFVMLKRERVGGGI